MKIDKLKFFAHFGAGVFGGTILGIAGFLVLMNYGGNSGCWAFIDSLFGMAGYESCGSFGAIAGILVGSIIGIAVLSRMKIVKYSKVAISLFLGSFLLPFLYGVIIFWPPLGDSDLLLVPYVVLVFMLFSVIPSLMIVGAMKRLR